MADRKLTEKDFDLDSGLFDGGPAKIIDARFEKNPNATYRMRSDTPGLTLVLESPDADKSFEQWNSIGEKKDWKVVDGGSRVVSRSNPDSVVFNMNSRGGHVVSGMLKAIGEGNIDKGKTAVKNRGFTMTEAEFYIGWDFVWKQIIAPYTIDGEEVKSTFVVPEELLDSPSDNGKKKPKKDKSEGHELDDVIVELAEGGVSEIKLKNLAAKNSQVKEDDDYIESLLNGSGIKRLVKSGKLVTGKDGKLYPAGESAGEDEDED